MGTIQGAMNSIIASTAAAAVSTKTDIEKRSEKKHDEYIADQVEKGERYGEAAEKAYNTKSEYTKPYLKVDPQGNLKAQEAIRQRYNQDKDFAARYDKVKAKISKDASEAKKNMKEEFEHKKFEKNKAEAVKTLTELQEHLEGGKK